MIINNGLLQMAQMLQSSKNPREFVYNMVQERMGNNPMFANLLSLAKQNREEEIEQIARNFMKEQGRDFDTEFNSFRKYLGL